MRAFASMVFGLLLVLQQSLALVPAAGRTESAPCRCCCHCVGGCDCLTDSDTVPNSTPATPASSVSERDGWLVALAFAPVGEQAQLAAFRVSWPAAGFFQTTAAPLYQQHCSYLI